MFRAVFALTIAPLWYLIAPIGFGQKAYRGMLIQHGLDTYQIPISFSIDVARQLYRIGFMERQSGFFSGYRAYLKTLNAHASIATSLLLGRYSRNDPGMEQFSRDDYWLVQLIKKNGLKMALPNAERTGDRDRP